METLVVGLGYKARHGKDSMAEMLLCRIPEARRYSFATALKCWCRVQGLIQIKDGPLLQMVGTDIMRRKDPHIWVRALSYQIKEEEPRIAIISDMRFPNEKEWIEQNGISVKVERRNSDGSLYISPDRAADHPSETSLDGATFNYCYSAMSGDMAKLEGYADILAEKIRKRAGLLPKNSSVKKPSPLDEMMDSWVNRAVERAFAERFHR